MKETMKTLGGIILVVLAWPTVAATLILLAGGFAHGTGAPMEGIYILWPVFAFVLLITMIVDGTWQSRVQVRLPWLDEKTVLGIGPGSSVLLFLFLLPIILNGISILCSKVGWSGAGNFFFNVRWIASPVILFGGIILLIVGGYLFEYLRTSWEKLKNEPLLSV